MPIEASDLILIAFLSGIGSSIGEPIGKWIWKKIEDRGNAIKKIIKKNGSKYNENNNNS
jgi:hypothetical protein